MNPTPLGWLAILGGTVLFLGSMMMGGNIITLGIAVLAIIAGGLTKKTKPCPFCRSAIDARATTCPKCAKDQPRP